MDLFHNTILHGYLYIYTPLSRLRLFGEGLFIFIFMFCLTLLQSRGHTYSSGLVAIPACFLWYSSLQSLSQELSKFMLKT